MNEYKTAAVSYERRSVRQDVIYSRRRGTIVTLLEPELQGTVSMATGEAFSYVHAENIETAQQALMDPEAHAMLVSPAALDVLRGEELSLLLHRNPGVLSIAVLGRSAPGIGERVLALGRSGVARIVDLETAEGFQRLRSTLETDGGLIPRRISDAILPELLRASDGFQMFMAQLIRAAPTHTTVTEFATRINVGPNTLASRFLRVGLSSPKDYLARTRLLYAAAYFKTKDLSIAEVAHRLEYSSPQSFGRHVRCILDITAATFRSREFEVVVENFLENMVRGHSGVLASFDPFRPAR